MSREEWLTMKQLSEKTGVPYPTLARYVSEDDTGRIPRFEAGKSKRFPPRAVGIVKEIRAGKKPGRPKGGGSPRKSADRRLWQPSVQDGEPRRDYQRRRDRERRMRDAQQRVRDDGLKILRRRPNPDLEDIARRLDRVAATNRVLARIIKNAAASVASYHGTMFADTEW